MEFQRPSLKTVGIELPNCVEFDSLESAQQLYKEHGDSFYQAFCNFVNTASIDELTKIFPTPCLDPIDSTFDKLVKTLGSQDKAYRSWIKRSLIS